MTYRPLPVRLTETTRSSSLRPFRRYATALLLVLAAAFLCVVPAVADPGQIEAKKAEARQVLAQIDQLDVSLEKAVEFFNAATSQLQGIEHRQAVNRYELKVAKSNLRKEQKALGERLLAIYTSNSDSSTISILLGATSLDDLVNRLDTVSRVSAQDARIIRQVRHFRAAVARQKRELASAHSKQASIVQQRSDARSSIESQLSERKQLVASIQGEITRLQAEERARQAELERQARARLLAAELSAHQRATALSDAAAPVASQDSVGVVASTPDAAIVPSSSQGGDVVSIAMQYLGTPYVWGGASPGGFDCSGLVVYVFAQVGISLPHYTGALWNVGTPVSSDQLQPGDLVFFYGLGHMGIYIGGGQFIHAPHTGDVVKISSMYDGGYASSYDGARRVL